MPATSKNNKRVTPTNYLKNVTRSVMYSAADVGVGMMPNTSKFLSENKSFLTSTYAAIKNPKQYIKRQVGAFQNSKVYQALDYGVRNISEDLRTGNFYNKERENRDMLKFSGFDMGDSDDFSDFSIDDDWESKIDAAIASGKKANKGPNKVNDITAGDERVAKTIEVTQAAASSATVNAVLASSDAQIKNSRANIGVLYNQNERLFGGIHSDIGVLGSTMDAMMKMQQAHLGNIDKNLSSFFNDSINIQKENNAILKEMLEMQRNMYTSAEEKEAKARKSGNGRARWRDININGMPNLNAYFKNVQANIKEDLSMFDFGGGDGNMLAMMMVHPLKTVTEAMVKGVIPQAVKAAAKEFDETISGVFGNVVAELSNMSNGFGIMASIAKYFGVDTNINKSINTGKYEKGPVPFDGITRKAIVDVIPAQLGRIEAAITGQPQLVFDYGTGRWSKLRSAETIYKNVGRRMKDEVFGGYNGVRKEMATRLSQFGYKGDKRKGLDAAYEEWEDYMIDVNGRFNPKKSAAQNGVNRSKYPNLYKYFNEVAAAFDTMGQGQVKYRNTEMTAYSVSRKAKLPGKILSARDNANQSYRDLEREGIVAQWAAHSNIGFDIHGKWDSKTGKFKGNNLLSMARDHNNNNIFNYLENINRELTWQRMYGFQDLIENIMNPGAGTRDSEYIADASGKKQRPAKKRGKKKQGGTRGAFNSINLENQYYNKNRKNIANAAGVARRNEDDEFYARESALSAIESADYEFIAGDPKLCEYVAHLNKVMHDRDSNKIVEEIGDHDHNIINSFFNRYFYDSTVTTPDGVKKSMINAARERGKVSNGAFARGMRKTGNIIGGVAEVGLQWLYTADKAVYDMLFKAKLKDDDKPSVHYDGFMDMIKSKFNGWFSSMGEGFKTHFIDPVKKAFGIDDTFGERFSKEFSGMFSKIWGMFKGSNKDFYGKAKNVPGQVKGRIDEARAGRRDDAQKDYESARVATQLYDPDFVFLMKKYGLDFTKYPDTKEGLAKAKEDVKARAAAYLARQTKGGVEFAQQGTGGVPSTQTSQGRIYLESIKKDPEKLRALANQYGVQYVGNDPDLTVQYLIGAGFGYMGDNAYGTGMPFVGRSMFSKGEGIYDTVTGEFGIAKRTGMGTFTHPTHFINSRNMHDVLTGMGYKPNWVRTNPRNDLAKENAKARELGFHADGTVEAGDVKIDGKQLLQDAKKNMPELAAGGAVGTLLGTILGVPFLGAAIGVAQGFIKKSDTAKDFLFGKMEDGKRSGGIFSKNLQDTITKHFPGVAKGGLIGILPGLVLGGPFGALGGLLIGGGMGLLGQTEQFKERFLGKHEKSNGTGKANVFGVGDEEKKIISKLLPAAGKGAAGGALLSLVFGGPFGLVGNMVLGAGTGMLTTSDEFKDAMLGVVDKDGKRVGGLVGTIKDAFEPLTDAMKRARDRIIDVIDNNFVKPLKKFTVPFINLLPTLSTMFGRLITDLTKSIGTKLKEGFGNKLKKGMRALGRVPGLGLIGRGISTAISVPGRLIGGVGDKMRAFEAMQGNFGDMTYEEMDAFMQGRGEVEYKKFLEKNKGFAGAAKIGTAGGMSVANARKFTQMLDAVTVGQNSAKKTLRSANRELDKVIGGYKNSPRIMELVNAGKIDEAMKLFTDENGFGLRDFKKMRGISDDDQAKDALKVLFENQYKAAQAYKNSTNLDDLTQLKGLASQFMSEEELKHFDWGDKNARDRIKALINQRIKPFENGAQKEEERNPMLDAQDHTNEILSDILKIIAAKASGSEVDVSEISKKYDLGVKAAEEKFRERGKAQSGKGEQATEQEIEGFSAKETTGADTLASVLSAPTDIAAGAVSGASKVAAGAGGVASKLAGGVVSGAASATGSLIETTLRHMPILSRIPGVRQALQRAGAKANMGLTKVGRVTGGAISDVGGLASRVVGFTGDKLVGGIARAPGRALKAIGKKISIASIGSANSKLDATTRDVLASMRIKHPHRFEKIADALNHIMHSGDNKTEIYEYIDGLPDPQFNMLKTALNSMTRPNIKQLLNKLSSTVVDKEFIATLANATKKEINNFEDTCEAIARTKSWNAYNGMSFKEIFAMSPQAVYSKVQKDKQVAKNGLGSMLLGGLSSLASGALNLGGKVVKGAWNAGKAIVSAPFKIAGSIGRGLVGAAKGVGRMGSNIVNGRSVFDGVAEASAGGGGQFDEVDTPGDGRDVVQIAPGRFGYVKRDSSGIELDTSDANTREAVNEMEQEKKEQKKANEAQIKSQELLAKTFASDPNEGKTGGNWLTKLLFLGGGIALIKSGILPKLYDGIIKPLWEGKDGQGGLKGWLNKFWNGDGGSDIGLKGQLLNLWQGADGKGGIKGWALDLWDGGEEANHQGGLVGWFNTNWSGEGGLNIKQKLVDAIKTGFDLIWQTIKALFGWDTKDNSSNTGTGSGPVKSITGAMEEIRNGNIGGATGHVLDLVSGGNKNNAGTATTATFEEITNYYNNGGVYYDANKNPLTLEQIAQATEIYNADGNVGVNDGNGSFIFKDQSKAGGSFLSKIGDITKQTVMSNLPGAFHGVSNVANYLIRHPLKSAFQIGKTGLKALGTGIANTGRKILGISGKEVAGEIVEDTAKKTVKSVIKEGAEELTEKASKGTLLQRAITWVQEKLSNVLHNWMCKGKIESVAEALGKSSDEVIESTVKEVTDNMAKKGADAVTDAAASSIKAVIGTALNIIAVVWDFVHGFDQAEAILGVEDVSVFEMFVAGLLNVITEKLWIVTIFIDIQTIASLIFKLFGRDLSERQAETEAAYQNYMKENPDSTMTKEEWLKRNHSVTGAIGGAIKDAAKDVKDFAVDTANWVGDKASDAWDWTKNAASSAWNSFKGLFGGGGNGPKPLARYGRAAVSAVSGNIGGNSLFNNIAATLSNSPIGAVVNAVQNSSLGQAVSNTYNKAKNAITNSSVGKAISSVVGKAKDWFSSISSKVSGNVTSGAKESSDIFSDDFWAEEDTSKMTMVEKTQYAARRMAKMMTVPNLMISNAIDVFSNSIINLKNNVINAMSGLTSSLSGGTSSGGTIANNANLARGYNASQSWLSNQIANSINSLSDTTKFDWQFTGGTTTDGSTTTSAMGSWGRGYVKQIDPRVSSMRYNARGDSGIQTIGDSGCGPAAAVNAVTAMYGRGGNPLVDAVKYAVNGGYKEVDGGTIPSYFGDYFAANGLSSQTTTDRNTLINNIRSGYPTVLMGQDSMGVTSNTPYGSIPHYVTATGVDRSGHVIIQDPESRYDNQLYSMNDVMNKTSFGVSAMGSGPRRRKTWNKYGKGGKYGRAVVAATNSLGGGTVASPKKLIIIGDSRTVGMCNAVNGTSFNGATLRNYTAPDGNVWICAGAWAIHNMKSGWPGFGGSMIPYIDQACGPNTAVCIWMGTNDAYSLDNCKKYIEWIPEWAKVWKQKGAVVYFVATGPLGNGAKKYTSSKYEWNNEKFAQFNTTIAQGLAPSGIGYIDVFTPLLNEGCEAISDNLHYVGSTYKKVYNLIVQGVANGGATTIGGYTTGGQQVEQSTPSISTMLASVLSNSRMGQAMNAIVGGTTTTQVQGQTGMSADMSAMIGTTATTTDTSSTSSSVVDTTTPDSVAEQRKKSRERAQAKVGALLAQRFNNVPTAFGTRFGKGQYDAQIWYMLKQAGLSDAGAAGIMGNMQAESGMNPRNMENKYETKYGYTDDSYTTAVDNGSYNNFIHDSAGYGLIQFTYYTLKEALLNYAKSHGLSVGDINAQVPVLLDQMNSDLKSYLSTTTDPREAAHQYMVKFERPADQSYNASAKRGSYAQEFYNKYQGTAGVAPTSSMLGGMTTGGTIETQTPSIATMLGGVLSNSRMGQVMNALVGGSDAATSAGTATMQTGVPGSAMAMVQTALTEAALADQEKEQGVFNNTIEHAHDNNVKYNTWYYGHKVSGDSYPWCAAFVTWCAEQSGNLANGALTKTAACGTEQRHILNHGGRWVTKDEVLPGDITYDNGPTGPHEHTGIVVGRDEDGTIWRVDGNYGDRVIKYNAANNGREHVYVRPAYTETSNMASLAGTSTPVSGGTTANTTNLSIMGGNGIKPLAKYGMFKNSLSGGYGRGTYSKMPTFKTIRRHVNNPALGGATIEVSPVDQAMNYMEKHNMMPKYGTGTMPRYGRAATGITIDYSAAIDAIIRILMAIADNTDKLNIIVSILNAKLGIDIKSSDVANATTAKSIKSTLQLALQSASMMNASGMTSSVDDSSNASINMIINAMNAIASE